MDDDKIEATSNSEKADMLNSFFSKCFNPLGRLEKDTGHSTESPDEISSIDCLYCEEEDVEELLLKLDTSKSNGPSDAIAPFMPAFPFRMHECIISNWAWSFDVQKPARRLAS